MGGRQLPGLRFRASERVAAALGLIGRVAGVALLLVFLCYKPRAAPALDVLRGVPASALKFVIRMPSGDGQWPIQVVSVVQSLAQKGDAGRTGKVMWATAHDRMAPFLNAPATIPYGATIPGYQSAQPSRLPIGRYEVLVQMGDTVIRSAFTVNELRRIE